MYGNWTANFIVLAATLFVVATCVLVHYEGLLLLNRGLAQLRAAHRRVLVLYAIFSVLMLHVLEIWIFGLCFWALLHWPDVGLLRGAEHLFDYIYFSAVTFTTAGYGDVVPVGPIRFMAGTESLAGFVMITWSASFTFLEMEKYWRR